MPRPCLHFRFNLEKALNALAYFAQGSGDLTKLKAAKLLYLADRHHFLRYARPITGDRYIAMDYGPVPEAVLQMINELITPDEVADPAREKAGELLTVRHGILRQYPVLRVRRTPTLDVFSDSEVEVLAETVKEYGHLTARDLVGLTHQHKAYQKANEYRTEGSSVELPYDLLLEEASDSVRALVELEQEDRDFADVVRRTGHEALEMERRAVAAQQ